MSDDKKPVRALTIRLGDQVFTDVSDYVLLIRNGKGDLDTHISNHYWAHGAVMATAEMMTAVDIELANHVCDCGGQCGEGGPEQPS